MTSCFWHYIYGDIGVRSSIAYAGNGSSLTDVAVIGLSDVATHSTSRRGRATSLTDRVTVVA